MWYTCHNCNGEGVINVSPCILCSQYNIYFGDILTIYGHIWCEDNIEPITPPSSPRIINELL